MRRVFLRLDCYAGATRRETLRTLKNRADFGSIRALIGTTRPHARMNLRVAERPLPHMVRTGSSGSGAFMANEEHVARLKQGVDAWNAWHEENPKLFPDLAGANLNGANLKGAILIKANLIGADLVEATLVAANLVSAGLIQANLGKANLVAANLVGANLVQANLAGANLAGGNLIQTDFTQANLLLAHFTQANLVQANLLLANLLLANLVQANLAGRGAALDAGYSGGRARRSLFRQTSQGIGC